MIPWNSILNSIQVNFDLMIQIIHINKEIHRISDAAVEVLHIGEDNRRSDARSLGTFPGFLSD